MIRKRGRDVSRLEAFSDAIFAFSATLLVVSLEVPGTYADLVADLRGFAAFALSFMALLMIWSVHNAFFRRYGLQDSWTIFINACLLFVVLFYVYPLKFIAAGIAETVFGMEQMAVGIRTASELASLFMLYSGGFVAVFLFVSLLYFNAYRQRRELDLSTEEVHEALLYFRHYLILVAVGLLSVFLAWAGVGIRFALPGLIYVILGPLCYVHAAMTEKRRARLTSA